MIKTSCKKSLKLFGVGKGCKLLIELKEQGYNDWAMGWMILDFEYQQGLQIFIFSNM
jgi:hypothetical protein